MTSLTDKLRRLYSWGAPQRETYRSAADTIERLRTALKEMIETQDEWERAVEKIVGRAPGIFERAIDRAKNVLEETE